MGAESEFFSLCWNNFHSNLSTGFHSLFQGEHLVDVTLAAEGRILKAHKMVLSVCSPYFNQLFMDNPCKHPIVFLKDVSASALDQLLTFMYRGEVSVRQDELNGFIKTGEALQIKGLTGQVNELNGTTHRETNNKKRQHKSQIEIASIPALLQPAVFSLNSPSTSRLDHSLETPSKKACTQTCPNSDKEEHIFPSFAPIITTKQEPIDDIEEFKYQNSQFSSGTSTIEDSMDATALLETKISENIEQSSSSSNAGWAPIKLKPILDRASSLSPNQPLRFMTSRRGLPVLVYAGHMYTLEERKHNKTIWVCVKKRKLNCQGCITTTPWSSGGDSPGGSASSTNSLKNIKKEPKIISFCGHNHSHLNDIIERIQTQDS